MTENGCSEDLPCSQQRISRLRSAGSCFCGRPNERRTARRTTIGALSRTSAWQAGVSHSATVRYLGRDQLLAGGRVAKGHRGSRRRCGASADTGAVPRRSMCCRWRPDASIVSASLVGHAAVSRLRQWGRLLAGRAVVAGSAVGAVLGRAPRRRTASARWDQVLHVLALVSIDRTGQRVEGAPRLVRQERHGRPVGGGLRTGGGAQAYACHDFLLQHKDALFSLI